MNSLQGEAMKPSRAEDRDRVALVFAVLLFGFVLVRSLLLSSALMPFEGWDECQHLAVAAFMDEHGRMPLLTDRIPDRMYPFLRAHPHPDHSARQFPGLGARNYEGKVWYEDAWRNPASVKTEPLSYPLYQAQHGPVYYHFLILLKSVFGLHDLLSWADAARMANSLFSAVTAVLWFLLFRRLFGRGYLSALPYLVCLVLAANSVYGYNHARIANDALANLLGCASLLLYASLVSRLESPRTCRMAAGFGVLGLLVGTAAVTKWNIAVFAPMFVLGLAFRAVFMKESRRRCVGSAVVFMTCYFLVTLPVHVESFRNYGSVTAMQEAVIIKNAGQGITDIVAAVPGLNYRDLGERFLKGPLHVGGWSMLAPRRLAGRLFLGIGLVGTLLLLFSLVPKPSRNRIRAVFAPLPEMALLPLLLGLALLYHAASSHLAWGMVTTNAWYTVPVLPVVFLFLLLGPIGLSRTLAAAFTVALAALFCWAFYQGTYHDLLRFQVPAASGSGEAFAVVSGHHRLLGLPLNASLFLEAGMLVAMLIITLHVSFREEHEPAAYIKDP